MRFSISAQVRRCAAAIGLSSALLTWCCAAADAATGEPARLEGSLIDGKQFSVQAQRGKVVLVVLWATWCPVCRRELPKFEQFYREQKARGFEIVALSVDDTPREVRQFLAKHPYSFPIGWRNQFNDNMGRVEGTPTMVLIDRQGTIRARYEGALDDAEWWAIEDAIAGKTDERACDESWFLPGFMRRAL